MNDSSCGHGRETQNYDIYKMEDLSDGHVAIFLAVQSLFVLLLRILIYAG